MAGILASYGYDLDCTEETADCLVVNSCTVKDPSQAAFMNMVKRAAATETPIVVAGCVPQADRKLKGLENVSMIGVQQIDRVVDAVEETLKGHTVRLLSKASLPSLDLPKVRKNPLVEIIPLSTGCLGNCTYCKTKHARGKLGSYAPQAILDRALAVAAEGVMEIWLSSEDTGAYGIDLGTSLSALLYLLTDNLPKSVMLRIGMTNPPYILDQLDDVAKIMNMDNVFSFLHVPVQAGSNKVLTGDSGMNREYTVEDFEKVCDVLLQKVPDMTIATDIICGFPNETEEDFDETMALMEKYRFHICNISQFYPRPGTPAAKMKRIDTKIVKNRSRRFSELFNSFKPYEKLLTAPVPTVVDAWVGIEIDSTGLMTVCHMKNYTKVLVPRNDDLVGCKIRVELESVERFHVVGKIVEGSVVRMVPKVAVADEGVKKRKKHVAVISGGVEHGEFAENAEIENCDSHNYKVDVDVAGGGDCCGGGSCSDGGACSTESAGEEKKEDKEKAVENKPVEATEAGAGDATAKASAADADSVPLTRADLDRRHSETCEKNKKAIAGISAATTTAVLGAALLAFAVIKYNRKR
jgi:threonylcarbamoyladenosine tRNA methylthiotransferase CDKAL1